MDDRKVLISPIYSKIAGKFPELKKLRPDITPLCGKYDRGIEVYKVLLQKKKNVSVFLDLLAATLRDYEAAWQANADQRLKAGQANEAAIKQITTKIQGFINSEEDDTSKVLPVLKAYVTASQEADAQGAAHRAEAVKLNKQLLVNLQKITGDYERAGKEVTAAIGTLATTEDAAEAQIRQGISALKRATVQSANGDLENALQELLTPFP
jgi:hypothetical protein